MQLDKLFIACHKASITHNFEALHELLKELERAWCEKASSKQIEQANSERSTLGLPRLAA